MKIARIRALCGSARAANPQSGGRMGRSATEGTMAYMLLILEPRGQRAERGLEAGKQVYAQMLGFAEALKQRGVLQAVESLATDATATRVQVRGGRQSLVDGPFAEAKEMVGGFFLLSCKTRD